MARTNYNIDNQTKFLDIHKQFNGGLKTVDTDDALNDFFLRQAENVSISEFGFLEKRYGLSKKRQLVLQDESEVEVVPSGMLQGHFKYVYPDGVDEFIALGGKFYLKPKTEDVFTLVTEFLKVEGGAYPGDLEFPEGFDYANGEFQNTREIQAVRIQNVLYIFTGSYPLIYNGDGNIYLMPYFIPDFNEISALAQGVNLLISDFDGVYGFDDLDLSTQDSTFTKTTSNIFQTSVKEITYAPQIPSIQLPYTTGGQTASQINIHTALNVTANEPYLINFEEHAVGSATPAYTYQEGSFQTKQFYLEVLSDPTDPVTACELGDLPLIWDDNGTNRYYYCEPDGSGGVSLELFYLTQIAPISVQYRASAGIVWEDVPEDQIVQRDFYTNFISSSDGSTAGLTVPESYINYATNAYSQLGFNPIVIDYDTAPVDRDPLKVSLKGFETGSYDFKITYRATVSVSDGEEITVTNFGDYNMIVQNVTITSERVSSEDYEEPKALWSCNKVIAHYNKLLAWGSLEAPETLFISDPEYKNWFPATATVKFDTEEDEPIEAITPFMQVLVVQSATKTWGLKGSQIIVSEDTAGEVYEVFPISPVYGTIAPKSVRPVRNRLYFLSKEGIVELNSLYAVDFRYNVNELDRNIQNIVPRDTGAVAIQHDYQYWIHFPDTKQTLRYYIDKKAWVKDTYDFKLNSELDNEFNGFAKMESKDGVLTFITQPAMLDEANAGIFEIEVDKSLPSDLGYPFKSTFETAYLNQSQPFHPKKYMETKLDFTLQNEYNVSKEAIPLSDEVETSSYAQFTAPLLRNHQYQIGFEADFAITNIEYILDGGSPVSCFVSYDEEEFLAKFNIPYVDFEEIEIKITGTDIALDTAVVKDITYDSSINLNTWMISEEGTLNLDNIDSYDAELAEVPINLGTVFGENEVWVFDESAFDDRITAIKTIKLSGRGYNYKLYLTDRSKSKWTLESIGITYKFKRARSR